MMSATTFVRHQVFRLIGDNPTDKVSKKYIEFFSPAYSADGDQRHRFERLQPQA
jgi:hypothetical protein